MCDHLQSPVDDDLRIILSKSDVPNHSGAVTLKLADDAVKWRMTLAATYSASEMGDACDAHGSCGQRRWWQQMRSCSDAGLRDIVVTSQGVDVSGKWMVDWGEARAEQLQLQGENHLASAERELPGRCASLHHQVTGL